MKILFLDTETTGTIPSQHKILQIAAEFHVDGRAVATFEQKIKYDYPPVDLGALKVNGVKTNELSSNGLPEDQALRNFVDFLLTINAQHKEFVICGHNVNFDINFLKEMCRQYGYTGLDQLISYRVLDTSTIGLFLNSTGTLNIEKFNSQNLFKTLGVTVKNQHDAAADVKMTAEAFYKMQDLVKNLPSRFDSILQHKQDFKDSLDKLVEAAPTPLAI